VGTPAGPAWGSVSVGAAAPPSVLVSMSTDHTAHH
jgi:hypothetical protein